MRVSVYKDLSIWQITPTQMHIGAPSCPSQIFFYVYLTSKACSPGLGNKTERENAKLDRNYGEESYFDCSTYHVPMFYDANWSTNTDTDLHIQ